MLSETNKEKFFQVFEKVKGFTSEKIGDVKTKIECFKTEQSVIKNLLVALDDETLTIELVKSELQRIKDLSVDCCCKETTEEESIKNEEETKTEKTPKVEKE